MKAFENLMGLARKKSRNHALMALAALKDLLGQGAVLPERKLRWFGKQPGLVAALQGSEAKWQSGNKLPGDVQEIHLLSWAYEDWLKSQYFELLQILEGWCNDEIDYSRNKSMLYAFQLLKDKPEQEENLLRLLINKLGDTERKVASRASYLLLQLQVAHPNMKEIIIKSIESDVLFRPGQNSHAKYYAIITLNQTVLSTREQDVARKLLDVYFTLFKTLLSGTGPHQWDGKRIRPDGTKMNRKAIARAKEAGAKNKAAEELNEKMVAQVLTGVNRAFPFAEPDEATFEAQLDTLYRVTHSSNFNTSIQALILIQMISTATHTAEDRFYRTLYESLLDPRLATSSKQVMYLNLLYKSVKADLSIKRVKAFVKRLLQISTLHDAPFICSALYLVSEVRKTFPSLDGMLSEPEYLDVDEEEHFADAPEDGDERGEEAKSKNETLPISAYDARKRDPLFANADRSCLWELLPLQAHFHPSVALFAKSVLFAEKMPEKPDPTLHTLMHFLDRFAYRNVRAKPVTRGISIMQPLAGSTGTDLLIRDRSGARIEAPLNIEKFWDKNRDEVKPDEVFFHQYFNQSGKKKVKAAKKGKEADDEARENEDEDEIWKALADSRPEIEGDVDEEGFSDMEDLMSEDDDSGDIDGDRRVELNLDSDDGDDGGVEINLDSDEPDVDAGAQGDNGDDDNDSEMDLDIAELESGDDVLIGSDEDIRSDILIPMEDEVDDDTSKGRRIKKRKLKQLPIFAAAEDYAELVGNDEDEDF